MLYKLSSRMIRKTRIFIRKFPTQFGDKLKDCAENEHVQRLFDAEPKQVESLIKELEKVIEIEKESYTPQDKKFPLYSAYTQDLIELLATLLSPIKIGGKTWKDSRPKPDILTDLISFVELSEYLIGKSELEPAIATQVESALSLKKQMDNFIVLTNLPTLPQKDIQKILLDSLQEAGARIVSKTLDVYLPTEGNNCAGSCVIFLEGWNIPERDEDLILPECDKPAPHPAQPEPEVEQL